MALGKDAGSFDRRDGTPATGPSQSCRSLSVSFRGDTRFNAVKESTVKMGELHFRSASTTGKRPTGIGAGRAAHRRKACAPRSIVEFERLR